jgi:hypothetical protein
MDSITLIKTSLEYYDSNIDKYDHIYKNIVYYKYIIYEGDIDNNVIVFYDKDKVECFKSRYEILGIFNTSNNVWIWSWANPNVEKKNTNIVRKLWTYGVTLDKSDFFLKTELITSRFKISNIFQLDIHIGIASYISKCPIIYKLNVNAENESDIVELDDFNKVMKNGKTIYYLILLDHNDIIKNIIKKNDLCEDN